MITRSQAADVARTLRLEGYDGKNGAPRATAEKVRNVSAGHHLSDNDAHLCSAIMHELNYVRETGQARAAY